MRLKCKIASESSCGKDCCCYDCTDANNCDIKCPTYEELDKKVLDECEELEKVEEPECFGKFTNTENCEGDVGCELGKKCKKTAEVVTLDQQVPDVIKAITDITVQKKKLDEQEKIMREKLQAAMEQYGVKSFDNEYINAHWFLA